MRFSKQARGAFSALELICLIVIIAILLKISLHYMGNVQERMCILRLKSKLTHTQENLSKYYTQMFMRSIPIDKTFVQNSLYTMQTPSSSCYFSFENQRLVAHIGSSYLAFFIDPINLDLNPRIYCTLTDRFCKDFVDKTLEQ